LSSQGQLTGVPEEDGEFEVEITAFFDTDLITSKNSV
jgi:hypothetical protein